MGRTLLGKPVALDVQEQIVSETKKWKEKGITPLLAVLMVEGDPASAAYAEAKRRVADRLGIAYTVERLPAGTGQEELEARMEALSGRADVHGILLELPLPKGLQAEAVLARLDPRKDVDGMTGASKLALLTGAPGLLPATPQACIRLLKHYGYPLAGKHAVLIGRGATVGMPLLHLLLRENATVTVCHSHTKDLAGPLCQADYVFVAAGRPGIVNKEMAHPRLVVIDAGINEGPGGSIVGDAEPEVGEAVAAMTPTPGGVGTLTTVLLFSNLMKAMDLQLGRSEGGDRNDE
ncbi:bifunctional 5,10-methylene-tetrahydrofolate dehydrogenase/5,10-methylene-tetrahydrofolate cyclohydrolase [Paenibacillus sp. J31TS4]|uniref:bifunctional 5,10-methylenetetrahydrofolate dehydrogenase/5,10-methenyltetrahydrofolate cyclohydrolase n=1 Tax=Paenibacillus sp. J31TS4 TaxID=2807195 RepID=UPI001B175D25|nr:bifunctional 5,10-methylenetetrahydrofolate dehydrogenase/5,10-methenyltetrahydrofolate cyclohydrolase [Paenibacillus sp. J31TS4]GIP37208.1 bifunctional 5,10-methylene-tetrahydrofolate dehydrogenase/5,10-methylene-tetrahydrofolate cyclohydrolase [Paenibacillus sp. J31TS4]